MITSPDLSSDRRRSTVRRFLMVAARRKLLVGIPPAVMLGLAWLIGDHMPPRYIAEATLAVEARKVQIIDAEVMSRLPQESAALRTELDVIGSRSLAERVVDKLRLVDDPGMADELRISRSSVEHLVRMVEMLLEHAKEVAGIAAPAVTEPGAQTTPTRSAIVDWLLANLKVSNDGRSFTIIVSFTSGAALRSAQIANAVADAYLGDQVDMKIKATRQASEWLGEKIGQMRREVESAERVVEEFRRNSGLIEAKGATMTAQRMSELNSQLVIARAERARAESRLRTASSGSPEGLNEFLMSPGLQTVRRDLADVTARIADARATSPYKLPALEAQAKVFRSQIETEVKRVTATLSGEVQAARKREAEILGALQQTEGQFGSSHQASVRLNQLQREADANRTVYESFLNRYKQTIEHQGLATPDARQLSTAQPPHGAASPKKLPMLLFGGFAGILLGFGLAFLREHLDQRLRSMSDIEGVTGIPVFGLLPRLPRWRLTTPQDLVLQLPRSMYATALRRTYAAVRLSSEGRAKIITVTSAVAGEGKTSLCVSLARLLAAAELRVLVIDADLHRARVAQALETEPMPQLEALVAGEKPFEELVRQDHKTSVRFLSATGRNDPQAVLDSARFRALLDQARSDFDVVIIDTPPVIAAPDAALVGSLSDCCLFVVRWGRTSRDVVTNALRFLRLCGVTIDGIVVSRADARYNDYYDGIPSHAPGVVTPTPNVMIAARR